MTAAFRDSAPGKRVPGTSATTLEAIPRVTAALEALEAAPGTSSATTREAIPRVTAALEAAPGIEIH